MCQRVHVLIFPLMRMMPPRVIPAEDAVPAPPRPPRVFLCPLGLVGLAPVGNSSGLWPSRAASCVNGTDAADVQTTIGSMKWW